MEVAEDSTPLAEVEADAATEADTQAAGIEEDAPTPAGVDIAASSSASSSPDGLPQFSDPLLKQFAELWDQYASLLMDKGYFKDGPGQTVSNSDRSELGAIKRANLQMSRQRIDLLYSLPQDKLVALSQAELRYTDRKTTNAKERMVATFVEGTDLGVGSGGAANTQDLVRMLLWARISCGLDSKRATQLMSEDDAQALRPAFVKAVNDLLPDIINILGSEPDAEALVKAQAAQEEREAQALQFQAQSGAQRDFQPAAQRDFQPRERRERSDSYEPFQGRERRAPREFGNVQIKPGDWMCPDCNAQNFARRMECYQCSTPRPEGAGLPTRQRSDSRWGSTGQDKKPGDWNCPSCNALNFARRTDCFQCNEPRPEGMGMGFSPRDSYNQRPKQEMRPGDWLCPECNGHNFASKSECFRCSFPRPASAGAPRAPRSSSSSGWSSFAPATGRGPASDSRRPPREPRGPPGERRGPPRDNTPADLDW